MKAVSVYGNDTCPYCGAVRMLLTKKGVKFQDIAVNKDDNKRAEMEKMSGRSAVPQVFIGDEHIGGFDELYELDKTGQLDQILSD